MSLLCLVPWPANTTPAWSLTLHLGARTYRPVEFCGPNLPLRLSTLPGDLVALFLPSSNNNTQSCWLNNSIRLSNSALLGPRCWWRHNNMRDVSRTKSPWYAVLMASKLVTNADLNWPLKKLGTPCKHRTLQRNLACKSIVSIASHPLRIHGGWKVRADACFLTLRLHCPSHSTQSLVVAVREVRHILYWDRIGNIGSPHQTQSGDPRLYVCQAPNAFICVSSSVSILGPFWVHFGSILSPFWVHFGSISGPFRVHFGSISGPFRVHFGSISGPFWVHFGSIWGPFGVHLGSIWGPFGVHLGSIWGPFWVHFGSILGPFCLLSEW